MNTVVLDQIPDHIHTAYLAGGKTREPGRGIPHISRVLTVAKANPKGWRLSPGTLRALVAVQVGLEAAQAEPLRLVDAYRGATAQAYARVKYEQWLDAGKPRPGDFAYRSGQMSTAYVAPADQSQHQWGGAVDIDVQAWGPPAGTRRGTDAALEILWDFMQAQGFTPIIADPVIDQSEAWHFNHLGALAAVWERFRSEGLRGYAGAVATCGCALAGTLHPRTSNQQQRYIQARLNIAGFYCGRADGQIGSMTKDALREAGCAKRRADRAKRYPNEVVEWMNAEKLGETEMATL